MQIVVHRYTYNTAAAAHQTLPLSLQGRAQSYTVARTESFRPRTSERWRVLAKLNLYQDLPRATIRIYNTVKCGRGAGAIAGWTHLRSGSGLWCE
eukprot:4409849-Pleurochrysis_carterae.AAC.1